MGLPAKGATGILGCLAVNLASQRRGKSRLSHLFGAHTSGFPWIVSRVLFKVDFDTWVYGKMCRSLVHIPGRKNWREIALFTPERRICGLSSSRRKKRKRKGKLFGKEVSLLH